MSLIVTGTHADLVDAINNFNAGYHRDYFSVRQLSGQYLLTPNATTAAPLAKELSDVLYRWGAGNRKAPSVRPLADLEKALLDPRALKLLTSLVSRQMATLSLTGTGNSLKRSILISTVASFDADLLDVLSFISSRFLIGNTNVTYPMKALMMLTGFMPALDSQVRQGLGIAGFAGTNATRFLLPQTSKNIEALKLTRLPFYLADCFSKHSALLDSAIKASRYPALVSEPGRVFDVLLFMQGSTGKTLLTLNPTASDWYRIP